MSRVLFKRLVKTTLATSAVVGATVGYLDFVKSPNPVANKGDSLVPLQKSMKTPPSRTELLSGLNAKFDVLIIGGGATGTGTAVDAATRGLNVCLLEKNDFASGTSSKSTKMAHGGVRYLEKAFWTLSKDQLDLVIEALHERANMLRTAPHLCTVLPIMIPVYKYWQIPYFYAGCKAYDFFAGAQNLRSSIIYTPEQAAAVAPMIDGSNLKAGLVYHDGSFNDARMNASLALTAVDNGATVLNYMDVTQLIKDENNKVIGAVAVDKETGNEYKINATSVVNATGPFADAILEMDNDPQGLPPKTEQPLKMVVPSSGVHVILPEFYCPRDVGLLDPATSDGRVMFFLPWQGKVLAGTTDTPLSKVDDNPVPLEEEIQDILGELQKYLTFPVKREDVLSAWSGIRPLARDPSTAVGGKAGSTQGIVRSHLLYESPTGLLTMCGGKWTTYREMSQETVDRVVKKFQFEKPIKPCQTNELVLVGGENFTPNYASRLIHEYQIPLKLAEHLASNYGTRAPLILEIFKQSPENQLPITLASPKSRPSYESFDEPFTVAELKYSVQYEYARSPVDFLGRRTRLAFLNAREAYQAIDGVVSIMGKELNWDNATKQKMTKEAQDFISHMGVSV